MTANKLEHFRTIFEAVTAPIFSERFVGIHWPIVKGVHRTLRITTGMNLVAYLRQPILNVPGSNGLPRNEFSQNFIHIHTITHYPNMSTDFSGLFFTDFTEPNTAEVVRQVICSTCLVTLAAVPKRFLKKVFDKGNNCGNVMA